MLHRPPTLGPQGQIEMQRILILIPLPDLVNKPAVSILPVERGRLHGWPHGNQLIIVPDGRQENS